MANFELTRYITIGRYVPRDSFIHRLDPRIKLLCFVLWVFAVSAFSSIIIQFVLLLLTTVLFLLAKLPLGYALSGVRPAVPLIGIMLIFEILFARSGPDATVLVHAGWLRVTTGGIALALLSVTRFLSIVWLVSLLTLSTSLSNLTHALEQVLSPLRFARIPVGDIVMMLTIALRFVPLLGEEAERLMKAQAARGADFGTARWWQIIRRTKSVFPILIPLFVGALHRGETLVMAMEVRGYRPGQKRTSYVSLEGRKTDAISLVASVIVVGFFAWCTWGWHLR
ncbi:energy-coupling factor transporter transmembrane component T family protein [Alicyclobacillus fodiniaquatilis]|uniref:Energy-coupling factor transporter transmembrane component T family protein n=1 Tax=Alicyclobacillus fodiniaquatilis TaxID=1661150 RepID=A0ABW4JCA0_9BACL